MNFCAEYLLNYMFNVKIYKKTEVCKDFELSLNFGNRASSCLIYQCWNCGPLLDMRRALNQFQCAH